ncbi:hypothetical protein [Xanthomarina gelatinilytica]|uniref:hypothetical protein n=1 Tax=Xanthomarina gelatinilytica TaxID=1137281 RepID=UPI003AA8B455
MKIKYTKDHLVAIGYTQLENHNAIHHLLRILNNQNELLEAVNKKLRADLSGIKQKIYHTVKRKRKN